MFGVIECFGYFNALILTMFLMFQSQYFQCFIVNIFNFSNVKLFFSFLIFSLYFIVGFID